MNNQISVIENINLSNMSSEQLQYLAEAVINTRLTNLETTIKNMCDDQEKHKEKTSIKFKELNNKTDRIIEDNEKKMEVALNSLRRKEYDNYVNQGDLGRSFSVSIGSQMIGRLLKIIGLAQKGKGKTTPYRENIPKYGKVIIADNGKYSKIIWHFDNFITYLDNWLKEKELYEVFYAVPTEKDMKKFINELYDIYC